MNQERGRVTDQPQQRYHLSASNLAKAPTLAQPDSLYTPIAFNIAIAAKG